MYVCEQHWWFACSKAAVLQAAANYVWKQKIKEVVYLKNREANCHRGVIGGSMTH